MKRAVSQCMSFVSFLMNCKVNRLQKNQLQKHIHKHSGAIQGSCWFATSRYSRNADRKKKKEITFIKRRREKKICICLYIFTLWYIARASIDASIQNKLQLEYFTSDQKNTKAVETETESIYKSGVEFRTTTV